MKCCDITAGQLNRKITISEPVLADDGYGGDDETWSTVYTPWARIKPKSGGEKMHAQRLDATGLASIVIRYRAGLSETMKVTYAGKDYQIRSIIDIEEAHKWIELLVERGVAQ